MAKTTKPTKRRRRPVRLERRVVLALARGFEASAKYWLNEKGAPFKHNDDHSKELRQTRASTYAHCADELRTMCRKQYNAR